MEFNSKNIVLTFAAISDIHFTESENSLSSQKFIKAMNFIKKKASANGLDAVLITGDLTDHGRPSEIVKMKAAFNSAIPGGTVLMYAPGNHEQRTSGYQQAIIDALGQSYFTADAASSRPSEGYRHCTVNGYHFFFLDPVGGYPLTGTVYPDEMKSWLKADLAAAAAEDPCRQIFVCSHPPVYNTVYGSTIGNVFFTKDITSILEKHPQVVYFSGHSHFPVNDERSIWQGKFTAVNLSTLYYTIMEDAYLEHGETAGHLTDSYDYSAGALAEIDANGNMRITRLDFANGVQIKAPWLIPSVKADGSHLKVYTADRWKKNTPPLFSPQVNYEYLIKGRSTLALTFDCAADDDMVHHYKIRLYEDGNKFSSINVRSISGFYRNGDLSALSPRHSTAEISGLKPDTRYTVEIIPVDSYNSSGNAISFDISTSEKAACGSGIATPYKCTPSDNWVFVEDAKYYDNKPELVAEPAHRTIDKTNGGLNVSTRYGQQFMDWASMAVESSAKVDISEFSIGLTTERIGWNGAIGFILSDRQYSLTDSGRVCSDGLAVMFKNTDIESFKGEDTKIYPIVITDQHICLTDMTFSKNTEILLSIKKEAGKHILSINGKAIDADISGPISRFTGKKAVLSLVVVSGAFYYSDMTVTEINGKSAADFS